MEFEKVKPYMEDMDFNVDFMSTINYFYNFKIDCGLPGR